MKPICAAVAAAALAVASLACAQTPPPGGQRPMMMRVQPRPAAASDSGQSASSGQSSCAPSNRLGAKCVSNPIFTTYLGAAMQCNGQVLTLAEMYAFKRAHPENKGIECTADWNAATGVIYCVDEKGYVSGSGIQNQAEGLGKNTLLFRCLMP